MYDLVDCIHALNLAVDYISTQRTLDARPLVSPSEGEGGVGKQRVVSYNGVAQRCRELDFTLGGRCGNTLYVAGT